MTKSRTEASRMVRGGRQPTVRGALYESTSIAAVYGTICSLVWGTMGTALNLGTRVPGNLGGNGCFAMQSGLFPRLGDFPRLGEYSNNNLNVGRSLENAKQPFGICSIRSIWLQVSSFSRARPRMCRRGVWVAALKLIEAHSHTLDRQFLDGWQETRP